MSWRTLVESWSAVPTGTPSDPEAVLGQLAQEDPDLYWYPGSGDDLMPFALDAPNNRTGERLFPLQGAKQKRKLVVWMNDFMDDFRSAPEGFSPSYVDAAAEQYLRLDVSVEETCGRFIVPIHDFHRRMITPIPVTIFKVRVSGGRVRTMRPAEGDLYTVVFSLAESEMLFRGLFVPHRLRVRVVALQRQGGCQRQLHEPDRPFNQYKDIPRLLAEHRRQVGQVEAYLVDHDVEIPDYHPITELLPHWGVEGTRMWVPNDVSGG